MNENQKIGCLYSWPTIIIALCVFWPVGVYLIIKRVSVDKKTAMGAGKLIGGIGIASYCIAGIGFIACLSDGFGSDDIGLILFFGIAGFVLQKVSNKIKKDAEDVKKYLSVIINGNERQIDVIASSMGKSYDVAKNDIQKLINKGYLKNAYINEGTREIILPNNNIQGQSEVISNATTNNVATKIVACPCCGANNTIVGDVGECEYCGSPLK
jgi:hypothetical protein